MWNFDHYLLKPCSPTQSDLLFNSTNPPTLSSKHSFISHVSDADEATETNNPHTIGINQRTNIEILISNSWPKSSRNMFGEKAILKVDVENFSSPPASPIRSPDIIMPEVNIGNTNFVMGAGNETDTHNSGVINSLLYGNESQLERSLSMSRAFSNSFLQYIDWGPPEFIDDF